jgi:hypothetical protein
MYASKKDTIHNDCAGIFLAFGWTVIDTSASKGKLLDMIIYKSRKEFWFVEIKSGNKKLTFEESKFFSRHMDRCVLVKSVKDAETWCRIRL